MRSVEIMLVLSVEESLPLLSGINYRRLTRAERLKEDGMSLQRIVVRYQD